MTGTAVGEARTYAETVLEFTWEAYETAAAHGWGGIATTMGQTAEHLEGVLEQLHAAQQSCATAATTLDGIDATTSSPEVIEHLGATFAALEQAQTTCQGALDLIDEATQNSEAVGVESLTTAVFTLRENTEQIHEQLGVLHTEVDAERRAAEDYARCGTGEARRGKAARVAEGGPPAPSHTQPPSRPGSRASNLTTPSKPNNPEARPEGEPEEVRARDRPIKQESIRRQNLAAEVLAKQGYRIEQLPQVHDQKSPDFLIEGRIFDCYSPRNDTGLDGIRSKLRQKIQKKQADRFVVNLEQSPYSEADLRQHLARTAPSGLQEVLVVKNGIISRVWP